MKFPSRPAQREFAEPDAFDDDGTVPERPTAQTVREMLRWGTPEQVREAYRDLPRAERPDVIADLTGRGKSAPQIAELLDVAERTVVRHRATDRARLEQATQRPAAEGDTAPATHGAARLVAEHLAAQDADGTEQQWGNDRAASDVETDDDARGRAVA